MQRAPDQAEGLNAGFTVVNTWSEQERVYKLSARNESID